MKIKRLKLENFRGYEQETTIDFNNLTALVGKNDIGKSSLLEALDIFFNDGKGAVKLEKDDICCRGKSAGDNEIRITVCFDSLPEEVIIDSSNKTSLKDEYLLNHGVELEVIKKYPNAGSAKIYIRACQPTNPACFELLLKKDTDLRKIIKDLNITCSDMSRNAVMRKAIWDYYKDDLEIDTVEIDVTKGDTKTIWDKLQRYLPVFSLFQADRKNSDEDSEIQDPLKEAVKQILNDDDLRSKLDSVAEVVESKLKEVSSRTLEKLREMSPEVAKSLNPVIPLPGSLKWADVFKSVTISGDDDIPLRKRGSGVRRLVLLSFFRAEAERRLQESQSSNIIYAFEEPETSQHTENQKKLIGAFKKLANSDNTQIIISTHSATVVKGLDFDNLRIIIYRDGKKVIEPVDQYRLPYCSLNEVNYLAFSEVTEEYHNELYGYLEREKRLTVFKEGKPTRLYKRLLNDGTTQDEQKILTECIRNKIHHPENSQNSYTQEELGISIRLMRDFIQTKTSID